MRSGRGGCNASAVWSLVADAPARRNRETQRAIRKRKAQKLQDSEVKIVMHEQEIERLRSLLEEAQHDNAVLRKQLQGCRCSTVTTDRPGSVISDSATRTRSRSASPAAADDTAAVNAAKKRKSQTEALASVFSSRPHAPSSSAHSSRPADHVTGQGTPSGHAYSHRHMDTTITSLANLPLRDLTHSRASPLASALPPGPQFEHPQHLPAYVKASVRLSGATKSLPRDFNAFAWQPHMPHAGVPPGYPSMPVSVGFTRHKLPKSLY